MENSLLWQPSDERILNSNIKDFINFINKTKNLSIKDYHTLYEWSIENYKDFWELLLEYSEISYEGVYNEVVQEKIPNSELPLIMNSKWFDGIKLNFADNLLRFNDEHQAIVSYAEHRKPIYYTYVELNNAVTNFAEYLISIGVEPGDRVAAYISNIPEAIIAMLATTSIGAIWSSTSPDFGADGVLVRFTQIKPKVLIAVDGYLYNGKEYKIIDTILKLEEKLDSLEKIIIVNQINSIICSNWVDWDNILKTNQTNTNTSSTTNPRSLTPDPRPLFPFDHPVYIMYSSGTTGVPKCIVHGAGGTLLQHFKELSLHTNLKREDKIVYFTTCGWMMWNWLVSSLYIGSTVVLFDGSPAYPNLNRLWEIAEKEKISVFGTSPKYLSICESNGIVPKAIADLSSLKTILSTGSPLSIENFKWVYDNIKSDVQLSSISGGTDIISCFMLGCPILPVYSGEIQCRGLGMKVEAWDEDGKSLIEEKGELICTEPFPSRPVFFWNDDDYSKFKNAYFDFYENVWRHGDFIKITKYGGIIVYGRSDATLNPGGVRIGTAEIYRVVEALDYIKDSLVVGIKDGSDVQVILFVVTDNITLNDELIREIKQHIKKSLTPRHVPNQIYEVPEIPYTLNGKKVELAVTNLLQGNVVKNKSALANPDCLKYFEKYART